MLLRYTAQYTDENYKALNLFDMAWHQVMRC